MSQTTAIEWTDLSWNPVHGCSVVSPGCAHCYAATLSLRYGQTKKPWTPKNAAENVILKPHKLREPLSGAKMWRGLGSAAAAAGKTDGKLVFVNSTSDLFHEQIPDEYIRQVFAVMAEAKRHTFQVLTKRPERMRDLLRVWYSYPGQSLDDPLPNVWLGVSIENRRFVDRADILRDTPAAVRFISAEPLLGPLIGTLTGPGYPGAEHHWLDDYYGPGLDLEGIDWVIIGGESGPKHRPLDLEWARDLVDHCQHVGTAVFVKQLGGARPGNRLADLPPDLQIREFPKQREAVRQLELGVGS